MSEGRREGIFGASGGGKTTLARELIASRGRVVIFDPLDKGDYRGAGFRRVAGRPDLIKALAALWDKPKFRLVYAPARGDLPAELSWLSDGLMRIQDTAKKGGITLLVDELNTAFPVYSLPQGCDGFKWLCFRGRHYEIDLIGISQRPANVGADFRGNETDRYMFRVADHTDLMTLGKMIGRDGKRQLETLERFEYLHWSGRDGRLTKKRTRQKKQ
jgi:hypothetical protein